MLRNIFEGVNMLRIILLERGQHLPEWHVNTAQIRTLQFILFWIWGGQHSPVYPSVNSETGGFFMSYFKDF